MAAALAASALWGGAGVADAAWHQATTRHFIVYADSSAGEIRALADRLERFDAVLRILHPGTREPVTPANRLTVYVLDDAEQTIPRLCGCKNAAGFYRGRVDGSAVYTPRRSGGDGEYDMEAETILFHEYAHHVLLGIYTAATPLWLSEGYPEFVATARFDGDRAVLGEPAYQRLVGLSGTPGVSVETMFAGGRTHSADETEAIYGRGWVLTHMAKTDPARAAQLSAYLRLLNTGTPSLDAARQAFGDLRALDRDMIDYLERPIRRVTVSLAKLPPPEIAVARLPAGQAAMMEGRIESSAGVDDATAAALLARHRPIAARHPGDAVVQGWFAEMAYDAEDDAAAEAAADRALAADPASVQALLYKARVRLGRAETAKSTDAAVWSEARSWILRANRLNSEEAAPLALFYDSFGTAGQPPSASAVRGLFHALELVPQDRELRLDVARQALSEGQVDLARATLRSAAYDPHAGRDNAVAAILQALDAGGAPAALAAFARRDAQQDAAK